MYELHENEQYFFDDETIERLSIFIEHYILKDKGLLCCLCTPLLGKRLLEKRIDLDILDIDKRFSNLTNFIHYNIKYPKYINWIYNLIVCDPPFFSCSLSILFKSIYQLSNYNFNQKILISYLKRRESAILGTFSKFNLKPTGFYPKYQTVDTKDRNKIEFYSNIENFDKQPWANLLLLK